MSKIIITGGEVLIRDFPLSPSENHIYKNNPSGRGRSKSLVYKNYIDQVEAWTFIHGRELKALRDECKKILSIYKILQVDATFHIASHRCFKKDGGIKKLDTFNYVKAFHDQLSECLWIDDRYFWDGDIRRHPCEAKDERIVIRIKGRQS